MMAAPDYLAQVSSLSHRQRGLIGALICICANTLISFALNVQKLAHLRTRRDGERRRSSDQRRGYGSIIHEEEEEEEEGDSGNGVGRGDSGSSPGPPNTRFLRSGLWWVGMSLMTLGEGGNFICAYVVLRARRACCLASLMKSHRLSRSIWLRPCIPRCPSGISGPPGQRLHRPTTAQGAIRKIRSSRCLSSCDRCSRRCSSIINRRRWRWRSSWSRCAMECHQGTRLYHLCKHHARLWLYIGLLQCHPFRRSLCTHRRRYLCRLWWIHCALYKGRVFHAVLWKFWP